MIETTPGQHMRRPAPLRKKASAQQNAAEDADERVDTVDTGFLETLIGYNARRAALTVIAEFLPRMAQYGLRPVEFSVMTLIVHNPGITSRQLSATLDILPPNLVGMVRQLEQRGLIEKREHASDRRAQGLHATTAGQALQAQAEQTASELEIDATPKLTATDRKTLIRLLRKIYAPGGT